MDRTPARLVAAAVATLLSVASCGLVTPSGTPTSTALPSAGAASIGPSMPSPIVWSPPPQGPSPSPGHELYGYLPYWEMDGGIVDHLRSTPLTTLALFSVGTTDTGVLDTRLNGYRGITGAIGHQVIGEAHARGTRVEVVFSSFGAKLNDALFADQPLQDTTIATLVRLVGTMGLDGVNVDVEGLDPPLVPAYGAFVGELRRALVASNASASVSVATMANLTGAAMAAAAIDAGADRAFMMGYDYRVAGSSPGASAPLGRWDGGVRNLQWSLDAYHALGVPSNRLLLGLPLYGMTWPVSAPEIGAARTAPGSTWIPGQHLDLLLNPAAVAILDPIEAVDVYFLGSDGSLGPPSPNPGVSIDPTGPLGSSDAGGLVGSAAPSDVAGASATPGASPAVTWRAVYVDSPATLARKLALANDLGLAGSGFWAIGYERGLPGYIDLMTRFTRGAAIP